MTFEDLHLDPRLLEGIYSMGYQQPSPVQQQAIPVILQGKDVIACAQTGTGKTAAYLLPVIHKILQREDRQLSTLIIAPTRELALQIDQQIEAIAFFTDISSIAVYGGGDGITWEQQKKALLSGTDIITATPGRLIAMLTTEGVQFTHLKYLILDEADRMLDMGFYDDIIRIISHLPVNRQTLLFSATMPPRIGALARRILKDPEFIQIAIAQPAEKIDQRVYSVYDHQKIPLLLHLLKEGPYGSVIIFASTREKARQMGFTLQKKGLQVQVFHSDLEQSERERILQQFKSGQFKILVGTDILSRGIDVEGIDLVVNYDVPGDAEDYVHRIGRTARASASGTAITFVNPADQKKILQIETLIGYSIPQFSVPAELGETPKYEPQHLSLSGKQASKKMSHPPRKQGKKAHSRHVPHRHPSKKGKSGTGK